MDEKQRQFFKTYLIGLKIIINILLLGVPLLIAWLLVTILYFVIYPLMPNPYSDIVLNGACIIALPLLIPLYFPIIKLMTANLKRCIRELKG
ncbi:MAG: hypothetical protein KJ593_05555 [Candidatus Omnitrophica bacterium]|nr:hypothetical protein [Candidatus Omnitrophota bacterium]